MRLAGFILTLLCAAPSFACPVCDTGTGETVRAGVFGSDFGINLLVTLLPFAVFAVIVSLIYYGMPGQTLIAGMKRQRQRRGRVTLQTPRFARRPPRGNLAR